MVVVIGILVEFKLRIRVEHVCLISIPGNKRKKTQQDCGNMDKNLEESSHWFGRSGDNQCDNKSHGCS